MTLIRVMFSFVMIAVIIGAAAIAGDDKQSKQSEMTSAEMPPMGPPEEIKLVSDFKGTWDVEQKWRMDPASEDWQTSKGVAVYEMILDGAAMEHRFESEMMGMPFKGLGHIAFNRETGKWQQTWMDNMGALISLYDGEFKNGAWVFGGAEKWQGMEYLSRITVYNVKPTSFQWKYEMSMDGGNTYVTTGEAVYTKRK